MIDHLRHMAIFARVVEEGSFRAAAQTLGLAPSRVSEMVSELEKYLGVTLLYRSTRKIAQTNEGKIFYAHVVEMLHNANAGLNELNALTAEPSGALRISVPAFMVSGPITKAIATFSLRYPKTEISVSYTDHRMRLIEDGFDVSISVGWLEDSAMMSRKLAVGQRVLVAGREYAEHQAVPERPSDLSDWNWIRFIQRSDNFEFTSPTGQKEVVTSHAQVEADSIEAVYYLATENVGATVLPSFLADRGVDAGKLVRLLPQWKLSELGIYAVWPDNSRRESLTLMFVRYLAEQELC